MKRVMIMSKSVPLNNLHTVWVTTWYGGDFLGTCYDISVKKNDDTQVTATFTDQELLTLLLQNGGKIRGLATPVFDTWTDVQTEKATPTSNPINPQWVVPSESVVLMRREANKILELKHDDNYLGGIELASMVLELFDDEVK
jgi:hypothetical protein